MSELLPQPGKSEEEKCDVQGQLIHESNRRWGEAGVKKGQSVTCVVQVRSEKQNVQMFRAGYPHRPERNPHNQLPISTRQRQIARIIELPILGE